MNDTTLRHRYHQHHQPLPATSQGATAAHADMIPAASAKIFAVDAAMMRAYVMPLLRYLRYAVIRYAAARALCAAMRRATPVAQQRDERA